MRPAMAHRALIAAAAHLDVVVPQAIRALPILQHCLILVREGCKQMAGDGLTIRLETGDAALLHAGSRPDIGNLPDPDSGRYRALALTFGPQAVMAFHQHYPSLAVTRDRVPGLWQACAGDAALTAAALHAAQGLADESVSDRLACHRCMEVLAAMAERGLHLPPAGDEGIAAKVQSLVAARPHLPWSAADSAQSLGISQATLRRRLAAENTSFRAIVAEMRLTHGLMLLQTSTAGIVEIALDSGYESPSRFAARFRERFGMSPSQLRGQSRRAKADGI